MSFLYPTFLWALAGLSIPVIIHLFYFRRFKKVYFSSTRFLQEIKEETSSRNRLKNLLVLLMRCLAIACLVFAFAQPFLKKDDEVVLGTKEVSIFIDNSFSMQGEQQNIPLLDISKARAREIVKAYSPADRFQILTHEFDGRYQRLISQEEALVAIDQVMISPAVHRLTQVMNRQKQVLKGENPVSYLISDFQDGINDLATWQDTTMEVNLIPVQGLEARNVAIDSVWFASPVPVLNENNALVVKLHNYGTEDVEGVKLSLLMDGQERPIGLVNISAGSSTIDTVNIAVTSTGTKTAEVKILDYPVLFDDSYFISFFVDENINVQVIDDIQTNKYLDALFSATGYLSLTHQNLAQIQFQQFAEQELIILNDLRAISSGLANELTNYLKKGGKVLVFPGENADISTYNAFLNQAGASPYSAAVTTSREVATINLSEFVFSDVFEANNRNLKLPSTSYSYQFSQVSSIQPSESIMNYRDGSAFIQKFTIEDGLLYVCAAPLKEDKSDLVRQAEIFVPMVYRMAISRPKAEKISYTVGSDRYIEIKKSQASAEEANYLIKGNGEFIPGQRNLGPKVLLDVSDQMRESGHYEVVLGENTEKTLAFNHSRIESDLRYADEASLDKLASLHGFNVINNEQQAGINVAISRKDQGIVLWKYFLWAAISFLLIEALLIRYMKS